MANSFGSVMPASASCVTAIPPSATKMRPEASPSVVSIARHAAYEPTESHGSEGVSRRAGIPENYFVRRVRIGDLELVKPCNVQA